ncbi:GrpB family protein [Aureispira anguillae]|uniref:GrpB family protein n=1 Tax=Aureispira anguillae TaxID=2864201 RepID=A0A915YEM3_9BACT|nr:GrpB family protein [Aureispira anguillae]BDS11632.1 GrpB family protein [Aureispira anguillae]
MKIEIVEYSPYWKLTYQKEEQRILAALKIANIATKIAHIGSTSIPQLAAKPIVDIMLGLRTEEALEDCIAVFQQLGYIYVSKYNDIMPFRRFFIRVKSKNPLVKWTNKEIASDDLMPSDRTFKRLFNVHVVQENTLFYRRHLAFRNHLRKNATDRKAYEALKLHLAGLDWESVNDYAQAKSTFINGIMEDLGFENDDLRTL